MTTSTMRPEHPARSIALIGFLLFGGMGLGVAISGLLAPNSPAAVMVGFLMLPLSLTMGMASWYTHARPILLPRLMRAIITSLRTRELHDAIMEELSDMDRDTFSKSRIFLPVSTSICFTAGCVVASTPGAGDVALIVTVYTALGLSFSMLVTWLARQGFLPAPT